MTELRLELHNCSAKQYAVLILRDDLKYTWQKCGIKLSMSRYAAREMYKRAKLKLFNSITYEINQGQSNQLTNS
jgi:hypothetical protein